MSFHLNESFISIIPVNNLKIIVDIEGIVVTLLCFCFYSNGYSLPSEIYDGRW